MDVDKLREELKRDEGCVHSVYLDHLNLPTTGIGHLLTEWDEEYCKPVGTKVSEDRVNELFAKDIQVTIDECKVLYEDFDELPEEVKQKNVEIIYTAAILKRNPLWQFFDLQGNKMYKRAAFLGKICSNKKTFAIAGTHGKTTTAAILTHLFTTDNRAFTAFVGGIVKEFNSSYISTGIDFYVVEADEYDRSFLQLFPTHAAITTMDADHLDIYGTANELSRTFDDFVQKVSTDKRFIAHGLAVDGYTFGVETASHSVRNLLIKGGSYLFDFVTPTVSILNVALPCPGKHNVMNAAAALALALDAGCEPVQLKEGLATFKGVDRRFSIRLTTPKIVIDDYAHHLSLIHI